MEAPLVWIIIGVAGSGKTTIGRQLAERLDCDFIEGDRRHPPSNIAKMAEGIPLNDTDRAAWLDDLAAEVRRASDARREMVMSCSALRRMYRDQLKSAGRAQMVLPVVPQEILLARLAQRSNHYMSARMLQEQLTAFELPVPDEGVWHFDGLAPADEVIDQLIARVRQQWPQLREAWWRRT